MSLQFRFFINLYLEQKLIEFDPPLFQKGVRTNILIGSARPRPTRAGATPRTSRTTSSTSTRAPTSPSLNFPPKKAMREPRKLSTSAGTSPRLAPSRPIPWSHLRVKVEPESSPSAMQTTPTTKTTTTAPRRQRHLERKRRPTSDKVRLFSLEGHLANQAICVMIFWRLFLVSLGLA